MTDIETRNARAQEYLARKAEEKAAKNDDHFIYVILTILAAVAFWLGVWLGVTL